MNANTVARIYPALTPEERFRLILAATHRGDQAERERLASAGQRVTFSVFDHAPYTAAFNDLSLLIFIELLEDAGRYTDAFHRSGSLRDLFGEDEGEENGEEETRAGPEAANAGPETTEPMEAAPDPREWSLWQRALDIALAAGYVLRTKMEGWKRFCEEMAIPPFVEWQWLPGFDRLQGAFTLTEEAAFVPEGYLRWLNGIRPAGEPELTEVPLTVEGIATATDELFRKCVEWWGG
jgi:hypothetical protein